MTPFELEQRSARRMSFGLIVALLVGGLAVTDQRALLDIGGGAEPVAEELALSGPLMAVLGRPTAKHRPRHWGASALPTRRPAAGGIPAPRAFAARVPLPAEDPAIGGDDTSPASLPGSSDVPGDVPQFALADNPGESLLPPPFNGTENPPQNPESSPPPPAAVPEPASWVTMILSMALVGGLMRRRQVRYRAKSAPTAEARA